MKTATVVLNESEHEVRELKTRKLSKWLDKLEGPVAQALAVVAEVMDTDTGNPEGMTDMVSKITAVLSGSIDKVLDLMIEFAPYLKDEIDECYTSEVVPAFVEVLKLAVPFDLEEINLGQVMDQLGELRESGSTDSSTLTSLPEPSGESGQT